MIERYGRVEGYISYWFEIKWLFRVIENDIVELEIF